MNRAIVDLEGEIWKDIRGYEGVYMISNMGRVKSLFRVVTRSNGIKMRVYEKILKGWDNGEGYIDVDLKYNNKSLKIAIHQLVVNHFTKPSKDRDLINHKNSKRHDNRLENLERVTSRENNCHRVKGKKKYSDYIGVSQASDKRRKKIWIAQITVNSKPIHLGYFHTELEAYAARVNYEKKNNIINKYL